MLQSLASFPHKEPARGRLRRNKQRSPVSQTDPLAFINDDAEDDFQCRYVETLRNRFVFGTATGKANNCLIDSLYQLAVVNNLSVERKSSTSDLFSDVRMELVHTYGAPEKDFLQHGLHGMPIMDILWNRMGSKKTRPPIAITAHSRQDVVCLPNRASYTNEDLLGLAGEIVFEDNYYTTLHLFNFNNTHYVPLIPK
ncbi:hypothetical protein FOZ60_010644 [Perkinsus olseni]|uniref:Uncharacterized protein n=1 Tax=Perkinsus olseni TaxID=32597 RepID=A0A7J6NG02_PEROL|nr:hypothetical protein FOZ60_010644 [Perkinsus olseni]